jgi:hypothetical protein
MHLSFEVDLDPDQVRGLTDQDLDDFRRLMSDVISAALTVRMERREAKRQQLVDLLVGDTAFLPVDMSRARLEAKAMRAIQQSTEWLTAAQIANLADLGSANPIATVGRWKRQGRIFALRRDGKDYYPRYALGSDFCPLPVVKEVMKVLTDYDPELLASWFDSSSRFLGGRRPREIMAVEPATVLKSARHQIEVQGNQA